MIEYDVKNTQMTVGQMATCLSAAYVPLIKSGMPLKTFPSVMLWGAPGVGKSQGVRQLAQSIEAKTDKKVVVTDVRLLLFNPVDLRGIPTANADKTLAVWLKPKIFQMDEGSDVINILFLDEISAAPQSVQAAAYQITLDRTVGEHRLPDNCIVIAAGNRVTDRSVAYTMPKALANRLCHIEIKGDAQSWRAWAVRSGIHKIVLGFLDYDPSMLMQFDPQSESLAFPTPRSWEMVSNILHAAEGDMTELFPLIAGCVGADAAHALRLWSEIYNSIPPVEAILDGQVRDLSNRPEVLYAVVSEMIDYIKGHHAPHEVEQSIEFGSKLPTEFKHKLFEAYLPLKSLHKTLRKSYVYTDWLERSGRSWDDYDD